MIDYPTRILMGTDGTEDSALAAQAAVALCAKTGAELHVVHVWRVPSSPTGATVASGSLPTESPEEALQRAQELLERQVEQIQEAGGTVTQFYLRMGQPPYEVVGLSDEIGADMLVVGRGRPRAVRRALSATTGRATIGSAADYIVRTAHCPVLVVRATEGRRPPDAGDAAATATEPIAGEPEQVR